MIVAPRPLAELAFREHFHLRILQCAGRLSSDLGVVYENAAVEGEYRGRLLTQVGFAWVVADRPQVAILFS